MKKLITLVLFIVATLFVYTESSAQCTYENIVSYTINGGSSNQLIGNAIDLGVVNAGESVTISFTINGEATCPGPPGNKVSGSLLPSAGGGWFEPIPLTGSCQASSNSNVTWIHSGGPFSLAQNTQYSFTAQLIVSPDLIISEDLIYCRNLVIADFVGPVSSPGEDLVIQVTADIVFPLPTINFIPGSTVTVPGGVVEEGNVGITAMTIQNDGSSNLEISAFNTIEVVGNWSDFPTAPQTITAGNNIILNPTITADPDLAVETPYRLRLSVVSNDTNSPHELLFEATGQPVRSNFQIAQSSVIAFDPVEISGLDNTKTLDLSNPTAVGITTLDSEYKIEQLDASDPDWDHFQFNDGIVPISLPITTSTLAIDAIENFGIVFEPLDLGVFSVSINVSYRDAGASTFTDNQIIQITGTGTTKPIDFVLVLDKSGSMNQPAGEVIKMEAMQNATGYFLSLLLGEALNYDYVDYRFAIIDFATNNTLTYPPSLGLTDVNTTNIADATIEVDNLNASGWTCIQDAMLTADGLLIEPNNRKAIIVLTDGNETPLPSQGDCAEALPALGADAYSEDLDFFSIGLGENTNFNQGNLDQIASYGSGNGFSQITYDLEDDNFFQLFKTYQEVFRIVSGKQGVDPVYFKKINEQLEVAIKVNSQDQNATITFVGELSIDAYNIEIFTPSGLRIYPEADSAAIRASNYMVFNANYKKLGIEGDVVGNWKLTASIENIKKWMKDSVFEDGPIHRMMIGSFGNSSYELVTEVTEENLLAGEPLVVRTKLSEKGIASLGARVVATITTPKKENHVVQLFDDGLHQDERAGDGIYGAVFTNTFTKGNYKIDIKSQGLTRNGERITRMETFSKFIGKITAYEKEDQPASNIYTLVLIWIVIILLLLVWFRVRK